MRRIFLIVLIVTILTVFAGPQLNIVTTTKRVQVIFFQVVFLQTWVIRARWPEIRRFVLEFKAS